MAVPSRGRAADVSSAPTFSSSGASQRRRHVVCRPHRDTRDVGFGEVDAGKIRLLQVGAGEIGLAKIGT
jgi:hypothetical protein